MYTDFETIKMSHVRYQSPSNVVPHRNKTTTSRTHLLDVTIRNVH